MSILIVTHCYAETLPQYAVFLRAQLGSLAAHPPKCDWKICVCHFLDDRDVVERLYSYKSLLGDHLYGIGFGTKGELFRRAIGRNIAALDSNEAEIVWFTDVDHVFGEGCIDSLLETWRTLQWNAQTVGEPVAMVYPKTIQIQTEHARGDRFVEEQLKHPTLCPFPDDAEWETKKYDRAIGGIQICNGNLVRQHGYLNGTKWIQPTDGTKPFPSFGDDKAFRNRMAELGKIVPIELPNLFRLRHTKTTYQGQVHQ